MPPEAVAPATPTPSPAPVAPVAPSPAPAPASPTPEPSPSADNPFNDVFAKADAHIAKMDSELPKPAVKVEPKVEPKPELKAEAKVEAPKPKAPDKPKSEAHVLRDRVDAAEATLKAREEAMAKLESKLKELETKGQDSGKVLERISHVEKERDAIAKERDQFKAKLKAVRLEEDPEFQKEHDQRFNRAADLTKDFVERLTVKDENGQPVRKFQWNEFVKIWHQFKDDPESATEALSKMVGDRSSSLVIPKMQELQNIERERSDKLAEARSKAVEMRAQEEAQAATERQQSNQLRADINRDLQENNPDFKLDPTDKELIAARDETFRIFDSKPADEKQRVIKGAFIRQMAGSWAAQRMQIGRLTKQLAEKTAKLEAFENPAPPPAKRTSGGGTTTEPDEDWATRAKRELV